MPKMRPKLQTRIPQRRRLWPSIPPPRKRTEERSGNFRLASPLASLVCAARAPVAETRAVRPRAPSFAKRFQKFELPVDQAFCSQVRMNASSKKIRSRMIFRTPIAGNRLRARDPAVRRTQRQKHSPRSEEHTSELQSPYV